MKLAFLIVSILSFVGVSFSSKDPNCGLQLRYEGLCKMIALGFTYDKTNNKCIPTEGACRGVGNFFKEKNDCVSKCTK